MALQDLGTAGDTTLVLLFLQPHPVLVGESSASGGFSQADSQFRADQHKVGFIPAGSLACVPVRAQHTPR